MALTFRRPAHNYEPLPRASIDSDEFVDLERHASKLSWVVRWSSALIPGVKHISNRSAYVHYITPRRRKRSFLRLIYWTAFSVPYLCLLLVLFVGIFCPSYTHRPAHYEELRRQALKSTEPGRANPHNEKVFIAASVYEEDGALTSGAWGEQVLQLIDLLGPQNVYLSIYEDNADPGTKVSLTEFKRKVTCNSSIVFQDLSWSELPRITLPNGESRIKRIAFLAEVRNRALAPLDTLDVAFDRLLFINDVNFQPVEAAQLLFSTNLDPSTRRANYAAACAVDFINPFKFYDRFATRDIEGHTTGIPFFPWFTSAGGSTSRNDVLAGSDAVRVRSCWGGMTAFEASWFQDSQLLQKERAADTNAQLHQPPETAVLRFRYDIDTFWESSECCLINADLQYRRTGLAMPPDSGIYMNPYVRVAYDTKTLSWLSLSRRPERLYAMIHDFLNRMVDLPVFNPRRTEEPGTTVTDTVWEYDDPVAAFAANATKASRAGHWAKVVRKAYPGGFCSGRNLLVMNEHPAEGEGRWGKIWPPSPP